MFLLSKMFFLPSKNVFTLKNIFSSIKKMFLLSKMFFLPSKNVFTLKKCFYPQKMFLTSKLFCPSLKIFFFHQWTFTTGPRSPSCSTAIPSPPESPSGKSWRPSPTIPSTSLCESTFQNFFYPFSVYTMLFCVFK